MKKVITLRNQEIDLLSKLATWLIDWWNYDLMKRSDGKPVTITLEQFQQLEQFGDKLDSVITGIQLDLKIKKIQQDPKINVSESVDTLLKALKGNNHE